MIWVLLFTSSPLTSAQVPIPHERIEVYFSPLGGAEDAILNALDHARKSVYVQAYSFTSAPIAGALRRAHGRGVGVYIIVDKSQVRERYSVARFLVRDGVPVFVDWMHAISHNKVMVIDDETTITGSYNFTRAAEEENAENLLVIHDPAISRIYRSNWERHLSHSQKFEVFP